MQTLIINSYDSLTLSVCWGLCSELFMHISFDLQNDTVQCFLDFILLLIVKETEVGL